jgi:hypothetical protein
MCLLSSKRTPSIVIGKFSGNPIYRLFGRSLTQVIERVTYGVFCFAAEAGRSQRWMPLPER